MTHSCTFLQSRVSCSQLWTIKPWSSDTSFLKLKKIKQKRSRRLAPVANRDALPKYFGSLVSLNKSDATNKKKRKKRSFISSSWATLQFIIQLHCGLFLHSQLYVQTFCCRPLQVWAAVRAGDALSIVILSDSLNHIYFSWLLFNVTAQVVLLKWFIVWSRGLITTKPLSCISC